MFFRKKLWLGISAALVTGSALASNDVLSAEDSAQDHKAQSHNMVHIKSSAAGEGGEGGEGGETGMVAADTDTGYLTLLGLMRGHLNVGLDLYRSGAHDAAATHMKHPGDELYKDLIAGLESRGASGFGEELAALAKVVGSHGSVADADAAYEAVLKAITNAEAAAGKRDAKTQAAVIARLVKTAAEEYDIAVEKGQVVNGHEYQDALGFVRVAQDMAKNLDTDNTEAVEEIRKQLKNLIALWPGVVPPETAETAPSAVYGAAARIELAALSI